MEENISRQFLPVEKAIVRIVTSIIIVAIINMCITDAEWKNIAYVSYIETVAFFSSILIVISVVTIIDVLLERVGIYCADAVIFAVATITMGTYMLINGKDVYLTSITAFFVVFVINYLLKRFSYGLKNYEISTGKMVTIIVVLELLTLAYVGSLVVLKYYLFRTPNFDFGIFSQMYYYMSETGLPMTTTERGYYLSHFAVHFSPIFYLILPIYYIFKSPVTLIVMQLLIVMSGAIPVYYICRGRKFSKLITMGFVVIYMLYPTMRSGLFYDFHENKFLPPLILWLLYFLDNVEIKEKYRYIFIGVFTILTLGVKEDAAIYVACIGLFNLVYKKTRKEKLVGFYVTVVSVVYFLIVFKLLGEFGEGKAITSIGRYDNLLVSEEDGLLGMILNIIKDPAYVISELLTAEKLEFVLWTMGPLLFVPFLSKKLSMFILMIPYMVMNLLTDYAYQYDIGFQYTYGSCTLLIYMAIIYFEGKENIKKKRLILIMMVSTLLFSANSISTRNMYYDGVVSNLQSNEEIFEAFEEIPKDASVSSSTWFVAALSDRKEVYDHDVNMDTDYVVFDMRNASSISANTEKIQLLEEKGYEVYKQIEGKILIMKKTTN